MFIGIFSFFFLWFLLLLNFGFIPSSFSPIWTFLERNYRGSILRVQKSLCVLQQGHSPPLPSVGKPLLVLSSGLINIPYFSVIICWLLWVSPVLILPATPLPPFAISHINNDNIQSGYWQFSPVSCIWGFLVLTCHLIWYLSCLVFSEFLDGTVVWCLLRILGNSQSLLLQIFLCTLPTSPITHMLNILHLSQRTRYLFLFHSFFLFAFQFQK